MCLSLKFKHNNTEYTVNYTDPYAVLPVRLKNGDHTLIQWGRRVEEKGELPCGGLAEHESILMGIWDKYFPKPVLITVDQFMVKDKQGNDHWHSLAGSSYIQGMIIRDRDDQRVFIVTIEPQDDDSNEYWPRIVNAL